MFCLPLKAGEPWSRGRSSLPRTCPSSRCPALPQGSEQAAGEKGAWEMCLSGVGEVSVGRRTGGGGSWRREVC